MLDERRVAFQHDEVAEDRDGMDVKHPKILCAEERHNRRKWGCAEDIPGRDAQRGDVVEEPLVVVLLFVDVRFQIDRGLGGDGVIGECKSTVSSGAHQRDSALHDAVELHEKTGEKLGEVWMSPETVAG